MVDESIDISTTGHLVMFAAIIEEVLPITVFLGLLQLDGGKKMRLQFLTMSTPS